MKKLWSLMLATILLITCSGCFWEHDRGGRGDHERRGYGDRDSGERGDHDSGGPGGGRDERR